MAAGNFCRYVLVLISGFVGGRDSQWLGAHHSLQNELSYFLAYFGRVNFFNEFGDASGVAQGAAGRAGKRFVFAVFKHGRSDLVQLPAVRVYPRPVGNIGDGFLIKLNEKKTILMELCISQWGRKRGGNFGNSISSNRYGWDVVDR